MRLSEKAQQLLRAPAAPSVTVTGRAAFLVFRISSAIKGSLHRYAARDLEKFRSDGVISYLGYFLSCTSDLLFENKLKSVLFSKNIKGTVG